MTDRAWSENEREQASFFLELERACTPSSMAEAKASAANLQKRFEELQGASARTARNGAARA